MSGILWWVPAGEDGDKESRGSCADCAAHRYHSLEYSLGQVEIIIYGIYGCDDWEVDGREVDECVAEIDAGQTDGESVEQRMHGIFDVGVVVMFEDAQGLHCILDVVLEV